MSKKKRTKGYDTLLKACIIILELIMQLPLIISRYGFNDKNLEKIEMKG